MLPDKDGESMIRLILSLLWLAVRGWSGGWDMPKKTKENRRP